MWLCFHYYPIFYVINGIIKTEVKNEVNFFQFQKTKIPMIWKMTNWNIQISIALKKDDYSNNLNKIVYILLVRIKALNF